MIITNKLFTLYCLIAASVTYAAPFVPDHALTDAFIAAAVAGDVPKLNTLRGTILSENGGSKALYRAIVYNQPGAVEWLLKNNVAFTAIHESALALLSHDPDAFSSVLSILKYLGETYPEDRLPRVASIALAEAAKGDNLALVQALEPLIQSGTISQQSLNFALLNASSSGHKDMVETLMQMQADPSYLDEAAIDLAVQTGHLGTVETLARSASGKSLERAWSIVRSQGHRRLADYLDSKMKRSSSLSESGDSDMSNFSF